MKVYARWLAPLFAALTLAMAWSAIAQTNSTGRRAEADPFTLRHAVVLSVQPFTLRQACMV
jgi:hypothetical protein